VCSRSLVPNNEFLGAGPSLRVFKALASNKIKLVTKGAVKKRWRVTSQGNLKCFPTNLGGHSKVYKYKGLPNLHQETKKMLNNFGFSPKSMSVEERMRAASSYKNLVQNPLNETSSSTQSGKSSSFNADKGTSLP